MKNILNTIRKRNWALIVLLFLTAGTQAQTVMKIMIDQPKKLEIVASSFYTLTSNTIILGNNVSIEGGVPPYQYAWLKDGQLIGTSLILEVPLQKPAVSSSFTLIVKDTRNCSSTIVNIVLNVIDVTAGGLKELLGDKISTIKNLILTGTIDARDFKTMRDDMPSLTEIDLSGSTIVAYTGTEGTSYSDFYPANTIPERAFQGKANLASVLLPSSATSTDNYAFAFCSGLKLVTLPEGLTSIADGSFHECSSITAFNIPSSVNSIGYGAFYNSGGIFIVNAGNQTYSSGEGVLFNKNKTTLIQCPFTKTGSYTIPPSVITIGGGSFMNVVGLTGTLIIPSSVKIIEDAAFVGCSGLTSFIIPASVTSIGNGAFSGCTNLTSITAKSIIPVDLTSTWDVFYDVNKTSCTLYVPVGTINAYKAANQWKDFINILEIPEFKLSATTATIGAAGGTVTINITTGLSWTASSNQSWLAVSPVSGTGNQTFNFTVEANSTASVRTATVNISATGVEPQVFTVNQEGLNITQLISLNTGWNIISANVVLANQDLKAIFQSLIDAGSLKKVMDETGKTIENFGAFGGWKNNIGNLNTTKGYKVNVTAASTLSLEGTPVPLPLDIPMNTGWNIISYPCLTVQDAKALVQSLIDVGKLKKVMDETGKTIENFGAFGGWKNNIGNFLPGKGYKVNVLENYTLTIPSDGTKSAVFVSELLASEHFKPAFIGNGTDHMSINLVNLKSSGLLAGDEIGVFDGKLCVGSVMIGAEQLMDGNISIPASANDEMEETVNGFISGHPVELLLYRGGQIHQLSSTKLDGNEWFEKNGSLFIQANANDLTGIQITDGSAQFKCYPNPFTSEITIEIQNFSQTETTVEIYNLTGQRIKNLFNGTNDGHLVLKWNGTIDSGQQVTSGVYLCKVNGQSKQVIFEGAKVKR